MFGPESVYHPLLYCFIIGLVLPIPFYFLHKKYPKAWIRWKMVNIPIMAMGASVVPQNPANFIISGFICAFTFQFFIYRYHYGWWKRYNYIVSAALDAGAAIGSLLIFIVTNLILNSDYSLFPEWWGNSHQDAEQCTFNAFQ